jgi:hypothetical protein
MKRNGYATVALSALLALLPVLETAAIAQSGPDVTFELRPHCVESEHAAADNVFGGEVPHVDGIMDLAENSTLPCPGFAVRDPLSKQTGVVKVGDTLDMDLVLHNPSKRSLNRFRAWIAYDSNMLEGVTITLSDAFPIATPGEKDFSVADNYIKVSGSTDKAVSETKIVLARITLKIKALSDVGTVLSFHNANGSPTAHTGAFSGTGTSEANVAATVQGSLAVRMKEGASGAVVLTTATQTSPTPAATASTSSTASTAAVPAASTTSTAVSSGASSSSTRSIAGLFSQLQVQALRVTTEGSSVFLAWNPLPSAELAGYNLYYGSISGRYLQKRSIDKDGQTATIRALPVGQTYYFAVRAVNASGQESDFSQEVGIAVGNPATSTSPLSGALIEGGPNGQSPDTDGNVAGESGPASWLMLIAAVSAVTGTMLAFRRQLTVPSPNAR